MSKCNHDYLTKASQHVPYICSTCKERIDEEGIIQNRPHQIIWGGVLFSFYSEKGIFGEYITL